MAQAKKSTLEGYKRQIKWGTPSKMGFSQGHTINAIIKRYKIPAKRWGYKGSLIGIETNKQYLFWRDIGYGAEFKGILNKKR